MQARAELESLQRQYAELQAKQTERGMVLTLGDVLFDTAQATLKPGAALHQAGTELILQALHTGRQGLLRNAASLRGAPEMVLARQGEEKVEFVDHGSKEEAWRRQAPRRPVVYIRCTGLNKSQTSVEAPARA